MTQTLFSKKTIPTLASLILCSCLLVGCNPQTEDVFLNSSESPTATIATSQPTETPTATPPAETPTPTETPTVAPPTETPVPTETPPEIDYSEIGAYEVGQIMIIMYHDIVESNSVYSRTADEFRNDLQSLYDRGFRLLSLKDLLDNNITTEAGYTPVVITFDDGWSTSFSLTEENGELVPLPDSGFDILMKFYEENPDFGMSATFFINGYTEAFKGAGTFSERLQYLVDNGCDIGNHTYSHSSLSNMTAEEITFEISSIDTLIKDALPGYEPVAVSYPLGERPKDENLRPLVINGETYSYSAALREGQSGAHAAPNNQKFDPLNMPRVRGSDNEVTDLWYTLRFYEDSPEYRYISDGDPQTIVVPEKYLHNVNEDSLNGKKLIIY